MRRDRQGHVDIGEAVLPTEDETVTAERDHSALAEFYDSHDLTEGTEDAEWTQRPGGAVMVVTSLRLPGPIMEEVRAAARSRGMKPTALIREWVEAAVAKGDESVPVSTLLAAAARHRARRAS